MMVGLYGNPFMLSKSLASLFTEDESIGEVLALIRGCMIGVEESVDAGEIVTEVTLSFERSGRRFQVMNYINRQIEDIVDNYEQLGRVSARNLVNDLKRMYLTPDNVYVKKLDRIVARDNFDCSELLDLRGPDGHLNLSYLYTYEGKGDKIVDLYNQMFIALKYNLMKYIEEKLTRFCSAKSDCKNNCLTLTFTENSADEVITALFSVISDDELICTCLTGIKVTVPSDRNLTFLLPTMSDNVPDYLYSLYDCDYIIYCDTNNSIQENRDKFLEDLQDRMAFAPDTKVDYFLIKDDDLEDVELAHSLLGVNAIPALKSLVGSVDDLKWDYGSDPESSGGSSEGRTDFFNRGEQAITPDGKDDLIDYSSEIKSTETLPAINFSLLKKELTRVGLSGFNGIKVKGWGEIDTPVDISIIKASDIKTDIFDDYDVAKVSVKDKELLMYYMDRLELSQIPLDYIEEHISAERKILTEEELQEISDDFTNHNLDAINRILHKTKNELIEFYSRKSEASIRDSYIKIVLGDICDEFYDILKTNIMNEEYDYNINSKGPNAYVSANIKICLLKTIYDSILVEGRKYWKYSEDKDLIDENVPNIQVMTKLLDALF